MVQAKVSPHLCFARSILPELESNLRWLLLMLGLKIPRQSQAVNLGWLLLVPDLGPLSKRYRDYGLTGAGCCLFDLLLM